jgi:N-acetylglucosaminylphosphatidylinositol deacetylase
MHTRRDLQDNITLDWDPALVASVIETYVSEHAITTVRLPHSPSASPWLTPFPDSNIRRARRLRAPEPPRALPRRLAFRPLRRAALHAHVRPAAGQIHRPVRALAALSGGRAYRAAHRAMRAHASQLVWFRHAYVLASRYMWVNDWVAVT